MYIDPDLVINKEAFKAVESNVVCSICNGVIINPIQCLICENSFCENCIEDWKKKQGGNSCPFRCPNPTFKNSRLIKNLLSSLIFKCENGCNTEIPYLNLEEHYNEKCPNIKVDYKEKYLEYKKKYEDLLKKYTELEINNKNNINNNDKNNNNENILRGRPNLKNEFKSRFHPHILINDTNDGNDWICNVCHENYKAFDKDRFKCENEECEFDICLKCILLEQSGYHFNKIFFSENHEHLLKDDTFDETNWICNVCNKTYAQQSVKRFRCEECDFDMCNECKIKEELKNNANNLNINA